MSESEKPEKNGGPATVRAAALLGVSEFQADGKVRRARTGKFGRELGIPTPRFWDAWNSGKKTVKDAGFSVRRDPERGWIACFWSDAAGGFEQFAEALVDGAKTAKDESVLARILAGRKALRAKEKARLKAKSRAKTAKAQALAVAVDSIPETVGGLTLRPYQRIGAGFLAGRENALLADDMGLGKTVQALAAAVSLPHPPSTILILCPVSIAGMWGREIAKAFASHEVAVCDSRDKVSAASAIIGENTAIVMPYSRVAKFETRRKFDLVISDEAHYLKTPEAKRSRRAWKIQTRRWWALTGTPVLNRAIEVQSLLEKFGDDAGDANCSRQEFAKRFCFVRQGTYGLQYLVGTDAQAARLQAALAPVMLRRSKKDVLSDLPAKVYTNHICDDSDIVAAAREEDAVIGGESQLSKVLGDMQKLNALMPLRRLTARAKTVVTAELASNAAQSGPVVVFSHFRDAQKDLIEKIGRGGLRVASMTANLDSKGRDRIVREFQDEDGQYDVAVASGSAFREGVTLTRASTVIFNDLDWTPMNNIQAEDRLHRIGQRGSVNVVRVLTDGGVDGIIQRILASKEREIGRIGLSQKKTG